MRTAGKYACISSQISSTGRVTSAVGTAWSAIRLLTPGIVTLLTNTDTAVTVPVAEPLYADTDVATALTVPAELAAAAETIVARAVTVARP